MAKLHILSTAEEAAQAAARFLATLAEKHIAVEGRFTIALSGGSTPRRLYQVLASPPYDKGMAWDQWHIFWGDERCVPPDHEDSNYRMASEALLDQVRVPFAHVHRMRGEAVPEEAADEYETLLREVFQKSEPQFDLILLGMGDDGHTASLFPGTAALQECSKLVMANWVPQLKGHRITFTLPLINSARVIVFLNTDGAKAEFLRRVLEPKPSEALLPAAMVGPSNGAVHWFLTQDAARILRRKDDSCLQKS